VLRYSDLNLRCVGCRLGGGLPGGASLNRPGPVPGLQSCPYCSCCCSTPVLATLLAYVSSTRDPLEGGALLFAYTCGYVAPLLLAASFTVGSSPGVLCDLYGLKTAALEAARQDVCCNWARQGACRAGAGLQA
jgi:hypothetical protein